MKNEGRIEGTKLVKGSNRTRRKSRRGLGCLSVASVVSCEVSGHWEELITRPKGSCSLCVCLIVCGVETCIMKLSVPDGLLRHRKGKGLLHNVNLMHGHIFLLRSSRGKPLKDISSRW
jgi:hypothetical protein